MNEKTAFEKARDKHLMKQWDEVEPFGYDHPDTYKFIQEQMHWAHEWTKENARSKCSELQAKYDKAVNALKEYKNSMYAQDVLRELGELDE